MNAAIHGLVAEFVTPDELLEAARRAGAQGYKNLRAYSPFPVEGLSEVLGLRFNGIAPMVLIGAVLFAGGLFLAEVIWSVWAYPFNIGGRPHFSWPAIILPALEVTFLGAAVFGFAALLIFNRLPKYYHPIFNTPGFERASRDRFFLCIPADSPGFDLAVARRFLQTLSPATISEVPV
ncbi:MAG: DUF3341 domain-containing protein [Gammaproteobacteria bacterium]